MGYNFKKDKSIEWQDCIPGDWDTYPKSRGQYLIRYLDGDFEYYMITYFHTKDEENPGFYFDADCSKESEIENKWGYKPIAWVYLPNPWRENGLY